MSYRNDTTQKERREVLRNDTLYSRAQADLDLEAQGRFAKERKAIVTAPPEYSAAAPWTREDQLLGPEPPLGIDVNAIEPTGEHFEVARSIARMAEDCGSGRPHLPAVVAGSELPPDPVREPVLGQTPSKDPSNE